MLYGNKKLAPVYMHHLLEMFLRVSKRVSKQHRVPYTNPHLFCYDSILRSNTNIEMTSSSSKLTSVNNFTNFAPTNVSISVGGCWL